MKEKIFNKRNLYFLTTGLIVVLIGLVGGLFDILQTQNVVVMAEHLSYPLYFFTLLGIFKILGAIALVLPKKFNTITNMAYAGFTFDFIFASFSHFSVGDGFGKIVFPLIILAILAISYIIKDKS